MVYEFDGLLEMLKLQLTQLDEPDLIEALNHIKKSLHEISPFKEEPVDCVLWVKADNVIANDYNPNTVAPPEMRLLHTSIKEDGFTQPIVTGWDTETGKNVVVDGFHRNRVGKEFKDIRDRVKNYLPITTIEKSKPQRMASTIRHNRARGKHGVDGMTGIVAELLLRGWDDARVCKELGMDIDELLRLKQNTGIAEVFKYQEFSKSWE